MSYDQIMGRVAKGIACQDNLFVDMVACMPEICAPHIRESDDSPDVGCLTMLAIIGKTALSVESGAISAEEAIDEVARLNTCEECPLKQF